MDEADKQLEPDEGKSFPTQNQSTTKKVYEKGLSSNILNESPSSTSTKRSLGLGEFQKKGPTHKNRKRQGSTLESQADRHRRTKQSGERASRREREKARKEGQLIPTLRRGRKPKTNITVELDVATGSTRRKRKRDGLTLLSQADREKRAKETMGRASRRQREKARKEGKLVPTLPRGRKPKTTIPVEQDSVTGSFPCQSMTTAAACRPGRKNNHSSIATKSSVDVDKFTPSGTHTFDDAEILFQIFPKHPLFSSLDRRERKMVFESCRFVNYLASTVIVKENEVVDDLLIVISGEIQLVKHGETLGSLGIEQTFGEFALKTCSKSPCDVIAKSDIRVLKINRATYNETVGKYVSDIPNNNVSVLCAGQTVVMPIVVNTVVGAITDGHDQIDIDNNRQAVLSHTDSTLIFDPPLSSVVTEPQLQPSEVLNTSRTRRSKWVPSVYLQDKACHELHNARNVPKCLECQKNKKRGGLADPDTLCSFIHFRKLCEPTRRSVTVHGFKTVVENCEEVNDEMRWLQKANSNSLSADEANYILAHIQQDFKSLLEQEIQFYKSVSRNYKNLVLLCKSHHDINVARETCDVCLTTLFNFHKVCTYCGFTACLACVSDKSQRVNNKVYPPCPNNTDMQSRVHEPSKMSSACFIPLQVIEHLHEKAIKLTGGDVRVSSRDSSYLQLRHDQPSNTTFVLEDHLNSSSLQRFQSEWKKGLPVLVRNIRSEREKEDLWSPEAFSRYFKDETCTLLEVLSPNEVKTSKVGDIVKWFAETAVLLKIKDWPPKMDFSKVSPDHFNDFMSVVPVPQYTRRDGCFNLAARFPSGSCSPDLGPKVYASNGSGDNPDRATTPLHLDVSDAVIEQAMRDSGADEVEIESFVDGKRVPGAIWHIFNERDADKIRNFLKEESTRQGKPLAEDCDPIHDQTWYISAEMRDRLQKVGVLPFTIIQGENDAVFIPCGCPHQVQNVNSCIQMAVDFVSPENMSKCVELSNQFRKLSNDHSNHADILQGNNVLFYSIRDALAVIGETNL